MLNPKNDRLDYGSILSPPSNYELDFAIGTTYSLDLDALVGASISLGLSAENDTELNKNPIFLLEALRTTSDKIALFCESGQIKLPNKPTSLYIFLEDMVFQVTNDNDVKYSRYASFHPKVWVLRYSDDNHNVLYRFAVLSRNLTFDRSWDISFSMDGEIKDKPTRKNNPLIKFIRYLSKHSTNNDKTDKINQIINELEFVEFKLDSDIFGGFDFIVNGIGDEYSIQNHQLFYSNSLEKVLIMSPFLSKDVIVDFNSRMKANSQAILITRSNSLSSLKGQKLDNFEFYALKDEVVDGESLLSEDSSQKQDIHAKMYLVEKRSYTDFYLGSLNASYNALNGNVEFMVKLWAKKRKFNIDKLLKSIFNNGKDNPFQLIDMDTIKSDTSDEGESLDLIIKKIVRLNASARVISKNDSYDLEVTFGKDCSTHEIEVKPLLSNKKAKFSKKIIFENLDKVQLCEFFVITITKDDDVIRRVIKISIDDMPEDRQKDVVSNEIKDKTAFIMYVAFLLGDEYILSSVEEDVVDIGEANNSFTVQLPELYEKMLKAAMYNPEKFNELEFLIKTLSEDNIVPEGFEELHDTFKRVINDE